MEEKSSLEIVKDIARQKGFKIEIEELFYEVKAVRNIPKLKHIVYMYDENNPSVYFVWYNDTFGKKGQTLVYCGVFTALPFRTDSQLTIRKKFFFDKLNIFSKNIILDSDQFNSEMILNGDVCSDSRRLLSSPKIVNNLSKAFKISLDIRVVINNYNLDFIPSLKGKSCIGIVNPQTWVLEKDRVNSYLKIIENIKVNMENSYQYI